MLNDGGRPDEIGPRGAPGGSPQVDILGVLVDNLSTEQMLQRIGDWVAHKQVGSCRQICTVNPEFIVDAQHDPAFAAALARSDLRVADGVGLIWAARLLGRPLRERVTGSDGIYLICQAAAAAGWRVYFLGAGPGVAGETARRMVERYPTLQVAGAYPGSPAPGEWPRIHEQLLQTRPDILFVAYGHPRQDFWIDEHREDLPAAVAIGVGGAFDFVAGVTRRAPPVMRRAGLEWLYRLAYQPWRWRRMMKLPIFVLQVLRQVRSR